MKSLGDVIELRVDGLGIVLFSPYAVAHVGTGDDYLSAHYMEEPDVQEHIQKGDLVGFGTGSPGDYRLDLRSGYPSADRLQDAHMKLRLAIVVKSEQVHFRDMLDLMEWDPETPVAQRLHLQDGVYHITLCSDVPPSGVLGDRQKIEVYFNALGSFPALARHGVPSLF